jgi:hypothetical protein
MGTTDVHTSTYEEYFVQRLKETEEIGRLVSEARRTRQNSLALTHLEDAIHRAELDVAEKTRTGET